MNDMTVFMRRGIRTALALLCAASLAGAVAPGAAAGSSPRAVVPSVSRADTAALGTAATIAPAAPLAGPLAAAAPVVKRTLTLRGYDGAPPAGMPALRSVSITQDVRARTVVVSAAYSDAPLADDPSAAYVYLGAIDGGTCVASFAVAFHPGTAAHNGVFLPGTKVTTAMARSGVTATVTASGNTALGSSNFACAYAQTQIGTQTQQHSGWGRLDVEHVKRAKLDVVLPVDRVGVNVKKWKTVRVRVDNDGDATAQNVKVKIAGKGVKVSPKTVAFGSIKPGKSKTKKVKVRISSSKTRTAVLRATASGGAKASGKITLLANKKTTKPRSLSGKLFWGADSSLDQAWMNRAVWFVDKKWAYTKIAQKGRPKCSAKVKGCVRYTYSPRTGKVKVGKLKGTVNSKSLVLTEGKKKKRYEPIAIPKKGTKLAVDLHHQGSTGCAYGYMKRCYTYTWYLKMSKDGKFSEASKSLTSGGPHDIFLGANKDERGRYRVLSKGRLELRYDSGKREIKTLGIFLDPREKPSPKYDGLLVTGTKYYR